MRKEEGHLNTVPTKSLPLLATTYRRIFPYVHKKLSEWRDFASEIPDGELRKQALDAIQDKTFHCEGGGIYAVLSKSNWKQTVTFVVAYQTISDYLDNLCDRSTSLDPKDFEQLHLSMEDALTPGNPIRDYYAFREEKDDGGYLRSLVETCQQVLSQLPNYHHIQPFTIELSSLYSDLQVHKHVTLDDRIPRLQNWFSEYQSRWDDLSWYEFSACSGSTLGIFCLVAYAFGNDITNEQASQLYQSYFPYLQGLHILLDYFIDQQEDLEEGDLNFCSYYENEEHMLDRFKYFIDQTSKHTKGLPYAPFHQMIHNGLVGMYLADKKVMSIKGSKPIIKHLLKFSGYRAKFYYLNTKIYHKLKPGLA